MTNKMMRIQLGVTSLILCCWSSAVIWASVTTPIYDRPTRISQGLDKVEIGKGLASTLNSPSLSDKHFLPKNPAIRRVRQDQSFLPIYILDHGLRSEEQTILPTKPNTVTSNPVWQKVIYPEKLEQTTSEKDFLLPPETAGSHPQPEPNSAGYSTFQHESMINPWLNILYNRRYAINPDHNSPHTVNSYNEPPISSNGDYEKSQYKYFNDHFYTNNFYPYPFEGSEFQPGGLESSRYSHTGFSNGFPITDITTDYDSSRFGPYFTRFQSSSYQSGATNGINNFATSLPNVNHPTHSESSSISQHHQSAQSHYEPSHEETLNNQGQTSTNYILTNENISLGNNKLSLELANTVQAPTASLNTIQVMDVNAANLSTLQESQETQHLALATAESTSETQTSSSHSGLSSTHVLMVHNETGNRLTAELHSISQINLSPSTETSATTIPINHKINGAGQETTHNTSNTIASTFEKPNAIQNGISLAAATHTSLESTGQQNIVPSMSSATMPEMPGSNTFTSTSIVQHLSSVSHADFSQEQKASKNSSKFSSLVGNEGAITYNGTISFGGKHKTNTGGQTSNQSGSISSASNSNVQNFTGSGVLGFETNSADRTMNQLNQSVGTTDYDVYSTQVEAAKGQDGSISITSTTYQNLSHGDQSGGVPLYPNIHNATSISIELLASSQQKIGSSIENHTSTQKKNTSLKVAEHGNEHASMGGVKFQHGSHNSANIDIGSKIPLSSSIITGSSQHHNTMNTASKGNKHGIKELHSESSQIKTSVTMQADLNTGALKQQNVTANQINAALEASTHGIQSYSSTLTPFASGGSTQYTNNTGTSKQQNKTQNQISEPLKSDKYDAEPTHFASTSFESGDSTLATFNAGTTYQQNTVDMFNGAAVKNKHNGEHLHSTLSSLETAGTLQNSVFVGASQEHSTVNLVNAGTYMHAVDSSSSTSTAFVASGSMLNSINTGTSYQQNTVNMHNGAFVKDKQEVKHSHSGLTSVEGAGTSQNSVIVGTSQQHNTVNTATHAHVVDSSSSSSTFFVAGGSLLTTDKVGTSNQQIGVKINRPVVENINGVEQSHAVETTGLDFEGTLQTHNTLNTINPASGANAHASESFYSASTTSTAGGPELASVNAATLEHQKEVISMSSTVVENKNAVEHSHSALTSGKATGVSQNPVFEGTSQFVANNAVESSLSAMNLIGTSAAMHHLNTSTSIMQHNITLSQNTRASESSMHKLEHEHSTITTFAPSSSKLAAYNVGISKQQVEVNSTLENKHDSENSHSTLSSVETTGVSNFTNTTQRHNIIDTVNTTSVEHTHASESSYSTVATSAVGGSMSASLNAGTSEHQVKVHAINSAAVKNKHDVEQSHKAGTSVDTTGISQNSVITGTSEQHNTINVVHTASEANIHNVESLSSTSTSFVAGGLINKGSSNQQDKVISVNTAVQENTHGVEYSHSTSNLSGTNVGMQTDLSTSTSNQPNIMVHQSTTALETNTHEVEHKHSSLTSSTADGSVLTTYSTGASNQQIEANTMNVIEGKYSVEHLHSTLSSVEAAGTSKNSLHTGSSQLQNTLITVNTTSEASAHASESGYSTLTTSAAGGSITEGPSNQRDKVILVNIAVEQNTPGVAYSHAASTVTSATLGMQTDLNTSTLKQPNLIVHQSTTASEAKNHQAEQKHSSLTSLVSGSSMLNTYGGGASNQQIGANVLNVMKNKHEVEHSNLALTSVEAIGSSHNSVFVGSSLHHSAINKESGTKAHASESLYSASTTSAAGSLMQAKLNVGISDNQNKVHSVNSAVTENKNDVLHSSSIMTSFTAGGSMMATNNRVTSNQQDKVILVNTDLENTLAVENPHPTSTLTGTSVAMQTDLNISQLQNITVHQSAAALEGNKTEAKHNHFSGESMLATFTSDTSEHQKEVNSINKTVEHSISAITSVKAGGASQNSVSVGTSQQHYAVNTTGKASDVKQNEAEALSSTSNFFATGGSLLTTTNEGTSNQKNNATNAILVGNKHGIEHLHSASSLLATTGTTQLVSTGTSQQYNLINSSSGANAQTSILTTFSQSGSTLSSINNGTSNHHDKLNSTNASVIVNEPDVDHSLSASKEATVTTQKSGTTSSSLQQNVMDTTSEVHAVESSQSSSIHSAAGSSTQSLFNAETLNQKAKVDSIHTMLGAHKHDVEGFQSALVQESTNSTLNAVILEQHSALSVTGAALEADKHLLGQMNSTTIGAGIILETANIGTSQQNTLTAFEEKKNAVEHSLSTSFEASAVEQANFTSSSSKYQNTLNQIGSATGSNKQSDKLFASAADTVHNFNTTSEADKHNFQSSILIKPVTSINALQSATSEHTNIVNAGFEQHTFSTAAINSSKSQIDSDRLQSTVQIVSKQSSQNVSQTVVHEKFSSDSNTLGNSEKLKPMQESSSSNFENTDSTGVQLAVSSEIISAPIGSASSGHIESNVTSSGSHFQNISNQYSLRVSKFDSLSFNRIPRENLVMISAEYFISLLQENRCETLTELLPLLNRPLSGIVLSNINNGYSSS